jgi:hypothetical protein
MHVQLVAAGMTTEVCLPTGAVTFLFVTASRFALGPSQNYILRIKKLGA